MALQNLQHGAGVRLSINGKVVGFATGLSWSRSVNTKVINEMDNPFAKEIMPTTYSIVGSLSGFRLRGSGGLDGAGIMDLSSMAKFFTQKYCVIEIVDILSGATIASMKFVVFDSDSWQVQTKAVITFSGTFKAVFMGNETSQGS